MMGYNVPPQHHPNSQIQMPNPHPQNPHLEVGSNSSSTLLVRHLPEAIPHETLSRLFSHYGASSVRPCAGGRLRNCAFVDFTNESLASQAHSQFNRLRFLGKVLIVEKADRSSPKQAETHSSTSLPPSLTKDVGNHTKKSTNSTSSATAIGPPVGEPIAKNLGVDYPFPPHLEYAYPPPDGNILTNIVNALIAVPRFYTQVLHLMNKMNIPAPFRMALPTPPLPISTPAPAPPPPPPPQPQPSMISATPHLADISSDESEMESSEEGEDGGSHPRKRARREAIVGPAVDKDVAHETVGLRHSTLVPKEMPVIKKKNPVLQIKIAPKSSHNEFPDDVGGKKEMEPPPDMESKLCVTPEEIERGKLPPEELLSLPMFKNYTSGNPGTVLYIKNLAKDVVAEDFYFIFGSVFSSVEEAKSSLSVKLMQEGRMRGQAFVTFPSVDLSHRALNLVNGYVFKGKPMIIQFGRNPAAGKAN